jgi:hypothetical protein
MSEEESYSAQRIKDLADELEKAKNLIADLMQLNSRYRNALDEAKDILADTYAPSIVRARAERFIKNY